MAGTALSPAIRLASLLFSVAGVGALIGFAWEHAAYPATPAAEEWSPPKVEDGLAPPRERRTASEQAILARALTHFPPYPSASRPEVLAADYLGAEAPMAVAWFSTQDTPAQVMEHYERVLLDVGLPVIRQRFGGNGGYVGYWSPADDEVRLVSTLAQGGETLVFVSAGQVRGMLEGTATVPGWVPLPPGLAEPLVLTLNMEGATHHTVSGRLPEGSLVDLETHYRAMLRERGWRVGDAQPLKPRGLGFEVGRDGVQGQVVMRPSEAATGVEVQLSLLQRGRP